MVVAASLAIGSRLFHSSDLYVTRPQNVLRSFAPGAHGSCDTGGTHYYSAWRRSQSSIHVHRDGQTHPLAQAFFVPCCTHVSVCERPRLFKFPWLFFFLLYKMTLCYITHTHKGRLFFLFLFVSSLTSFPTWISNWNSKKKDKSCCPFSSSKRPEPTCCVRDESPTSHRSSSQQVFSVLVCSSGSKQSSPFSSSLLLFISWHQ